MLLKAKITFLFIILTVGLKQCRDQRACQIFSQNLLIIRKSVDRTQGQNIAEVMSAIDFFERITGITSHSDGNYFGRYQPTGEDYTNWSNWFKKNSDMLYWDEKEQKVKTRLLPK